MANTTLETSTESNFPIKVQYFDREHSTLVLHPEDIRPDMSFLVLETKCSTVQGAHPC